MATVSLVQMPHSDLVELCNVIGKTPALRRDVTHRLAERAMPHLRRVAASERVIGGATNAAHDRWTFASTCTPYLLAAITPKDMLDKLEALDALDGDDTLEQWFLAEAAELGVVPEKLSRAKYRVPHVDEVSEWCAQLLDRVAVLRTRVLGWSGTPQQRADYAIATWVHLAWIFARLQPCFTQTRRSLGACTLRSPKATLEMPAQRPAGLRGWLRALGKRPVEITPAIDSSIPGLRDLMISTADLVPSLGMGGQRESLPLQGSERMASGAVPFAHLTQLAELFANATVDDTWRTLVTVAARRAELATAHLVECSEAFATGARWPMFADLHAPLEDAASNSAQPTVN